MGKLPHLLSQNWATNEQTQTISNTFGSEGMQAQRWAWGLILCAGINRVRQMGIRARGQQFFLEYIFGFHRNPHK